MENTATINADLNLVERMERSVKKAQSDTGMQAKLDTIARESGEAYEKHRKAMAKTAARTWFKRYGCSMA